MTTPPWDGTLPHDPPGAVPLGPDRTRFLVWAPNATAVELHLVAPEKRLVPLTRRPGGYHEGEVAVGPGARYFFRCDGADDRPDPASRLQPEGVHGPSEVVDPAFRWTDGAWKGVALEDMVFYEMHVGTFTEEGTFDAAIARLPSLRELGITAVEIMPVAQFPGTRNWGYDGAHPYAVQASYGGPAGLKRLVDACHREGMAVVLDVVYNHLGPEGNYLGVYGPYFTSRYVTPWGRALNFDGAGSDEVRRYFIENALRWVDEFRIDALRLDAIHAIIDPSAQPFLGELSRAVHARARALGRPIWLIGESDLNDPRILQPAEQNGFGLDAQWSDDFHHCLHALLTGESSGYYVDFGRLDQLATAFTQAYVYSGQYSAYRGRRHGGPAGSLRGCQFVVYAQNHDQVGNRMNGDRLSTLVSFERLKVAAGAVALSPYLPMLFMGEEYGETAPFQYFVSHGDPALVEATRKGRRDEFAAFKESGEAPDPQDPTTFARSRLRPERGSSGRGAQLRALYRELFALRRSTPVLADPRRVRTEAVAESGTLVLRRWDEAGGEALIVLRFADGAGAATLPSRAGRWTRRLDSSDAAFGGPGSTAPKSLVLDRERPVELPEPGVLVYLKE